MAAVFRLALTVALLLGFGQTWALVPMQSGFRVNSGPVKASAAEACAAYGPIFTPSLISTSINSDGRCVLNYRNGAGNPDSTTAVVDQVSSGVCPANSASVSGGCQCNSGYVENTAKTACEVQLSAHDRYCQENAGSLNSVFKIRYSGVTANGQACEQPYFSQPGLAADAGCVADVGSGLITTDHEGVKWFQGTATMTAAKCNGSLANPSATGNEKEQEQGKKDPCPNGYPGEVNGTTVCAQHDPNGGIDWTGSATKKGADGTSVDTKTETKCAAGKCETTKTETQRDAAGTATGTSSTKTTESLGELCARDKGNKVCSATGNGGGEEGGSSFSGNCASGFQAKSDDAVTNAMALEQHKRNCKFFDEKPEPNEDTNEADAMRAKGKSGADQTEDLPGNLKRSVQISGSDFNTSNAIGAQSCFTDRSVQVFGRSVAIPLSLVCPWLDIIGDLLMIVGWLLAARIVIRG